MDRTPTRIMLETEPSVSASLARRSRTPNEDADDEDEYATNNDLEGGLQERRIHIARADPGDHGQLDRDDGEGDRGRDIEVGNEIRQRVAEAAERGHPAAHYAPHHGCAAAGERAVIG